MTPPPVVVWSPDTEPLVSTEGVDLLWILTYCIAFFLEWPRMDKPNTDSREKSCTFLRGKRETRGVCSWLQSATSQPGAAKSYTLDL